MGRLVILEERRQLALESFRDILRDYGDRSIALDPRPRYEAVYLLTRFPAEYQGFRAVDSRVRNPAGFPRGGGELAERRGVERACERSDRKRFRGWH